jgi:ATP-dependent RNA helicase DDX3X
MLATDKTTATPKTPPYDISANTTYSTILSVTQPQIRKIILGKDMPSKNLRQTFLFSATFPDTIKNLAKNFLRDNYIFISVGRVGSTVKNIHQRLIECSSDQNMKIKLLISTIKEVEGRTLIFVQKKKTASWVNSFLHNSGIKSEEIHGNCTQLQRENSLKNFKNGNNLILIATDVAARGLDVPSVTHVIQFDMPMSSEDFDTYVHRIGRTGRAGKNGVATSFYVPGRGGEGNGGIAAQLLELMTENNQVSKCCIAHTT